VWGGDESSEGGKRSEKQHGAYSTREIKKKGKNRGETSTRGNKNGASASVLIIAEREEGGASAEKKGGPLY